MRAVEFLYGVTALVGPVDRASESAKTVIRPVASDARGGINFARLRAIYVRLESGWIPKELSMSESDGLIRFWGNNAEAVFDGLA
jgi:hypothetical protein